MKYILLYADGYYDNGDIGWKFFDDQQKALDYIAYRLKRSSIPTLKSYTLIRGEILELEEAEVIKKVKIK
jgi:hypothetical protein